MVVDRKCYVNFKTVCVCNYKDKNIEGCEKYVCIDEDQFLSIQLLVWFIVLFRGVVGYYYLKSLG